VVRPVGGDGLPSLDEGLGSGAGLALADEALDRRGARAVCARVRSSSPRPSPQVDIMNKTLPALAILAALLATCGSSTQQTSPSSAAASETTIGSPSTDVSAVVADLCAPPAYARCAAGAPLFVGAMDAGALLAVCDHGDGTGDVVWIDSGKEADAEAKCSGNGLISPSKVVRVVRLP
jgi:hypothetical protein